MEMFGRRAPPEEERKVKANNREYNEKFHYANNCITTSKYNLFTFLPINLFNQFHQVANIYFFLLLVFELIPQISSLSWHTTLIPLVTVLTINAVRDATDDYFHHENDKQVNNRQSQVFIKGSLKNEKWMNIKVGDIVKLENNQVAAADLLLLSSSEPNGLCYIETAELDGETNLKVRQPVSVFVDLGNDLASFDGEVVCEPPNNKLDRFRGKLFWKGNDYYLTNDNILLRGCILRNTEACYGLVIFAGPDTKVMLNSGCTKFKRTVIDRLMNTLVLWIFGFLGSIAVSLAVCNALWNTYYGSLQSYISQTPNGESYMWIGFLVIWAHILILNTLVPMSVYVSVEAIRWGHTHFINWDRQMFCSQNDTPAEARISNLCDELGQVEYIFSDKTGTLTQNIMIFNKCSINGKIYGEVTDTHPTRVDFTAFNPLAETNFVFYDSNLLESVKVGDSHIHEFFRLLSLCHTIMSEETSNGELIYKAQSPDENALVTAARNFGFVFHSRSPGTITTTELGHRVTYSLLAILDFNFIRKRMSVIVRNPEGKIRLYCKGADTVLLERLHPCNQELMRITSDHLLEFAADGLRTLALAYKDLSEVEWKIWSESIDTAKRATDGKEERLDAVYEKMEQDMMLVGATAIEDKLQEGVEETIALLSLANIKIWVLTGDKQETAVNIGYSCKMLTDDMVQVFTISGNTVTSVRQELRMAKKAMFELSQAKNEKGEKCENSNCTNIVYDTAQEEDGVGGGSEEVKQLPSTWTCPLDTGAMQNIPAEFGLVINGFSLTHALEADMEEEFVSTACACKAVICCRVTPHQKAQVVEVIKKYKKVVTLAVGDGANDVRMIKTAHIGVSISGQEGNQAMLASDFTFAQFRFLKRLLLVHGRWSYFRMCRFLRYSFYKNFAFTFVHIWYGFFCGFSAQTLYDHFFITFYNIIYTSFPVMAMGMFDQDVPDYKCLEHPKLYEPGQLNQCFNKKDFFICLGQGFYTSMVLFFVPYVLLSDATQKNGVPLSDYQTFSVTSMTALVIVVTVQIALDTCYWTIFNHLFLWGSLGLFFLLLFVQHSQTLFHWSPIHYSFVGCAAGTLQQPIVWLTIALATVMCTVPVLALHFLKVILNPQLSDVVRYIFLTQQRKKKQEHSKVGSVWFGAYNRSKRNHRAEPRTKRSGYAFAHQEGFGELITSGKMRLPFLAQATSSWLNAMRGRKNNAIHASNAVLGDSSPGTSNTTSHASSSLFHGGSHEMLNGEQAAATLAQSKQTDSTKTSGASPSQSSSRAERIYGDGATEEPHPKR